MNYCDEMASEEHLTLSTEIKSLHKILRDKTKKLGAKRAWQEHLQSKSKLSSYAKAMKELAIKHWETNDRKAESISNAKRFQQRNRISWTTNYCRDYFQKAAFISGLRQRELRILDELKIDCTEFNQMINLSNRFPVEKIKLLDVGSCYNPFGRFNEFNVIPIDIAPAVDDVYECDFLNVELTGTIDTEKTMNSTEGASKKITKLNVNSFDVVVFSLLLEYLPTSEQRIMCCEKAYQLLAAEGIFIIITPDSKHVGANAKIMKTWRYALALMGFGRIKYEKLEHITCMAFRKCFDAEVSRRWARIHKEPYMDYKIEIPQDFNDSETNESNESDTLPQPNNPSPTVDTYDISNNCISGQDNFCDE